VNNANKVAYGYSLAVLQWKKQSRPKIQ